MFESRDAYIYLGPFSIKRRKTENDRNGGHTQETKWGQGSRESENLGVGKLRKVPNTESITLKTRVQTPTTRLKTSRRQAGAGVSRRSPGNPCRREENMAEGDWC